MPDGRPLKFHKYDNIMEKQIMIAYISKCISIEDTDSMCPYDRDFIYDKLLEIKQLEKENMDKLMNN